MGKPFSFKISEEEKQRWSEVAASMGISLEQLINIAIAEALEADSTGVYDVKTEFSYGGGSGHTQGQYGWGGTAGGYEASR